MCLFEALYDRKCNMLLSWDNLANIIVIGPELLREMEEKMVMIRKNLKVAQDSQKSSADKRTYKEFKVGICVFKNKG